METTDAGRQEARLEPVVGQYDRFVAAFTPRRKDDLQPGSERWVGKSATWMAAWPIEFGEYAGEYAMTPMDGDWRENAPFAWVPSGDLTPNADVKPTAASRGSA